MLARLDSRCTSRTHHKCSLPAIMQQSPRAHALLHIPAHCLWLITQESGAGWLNLATGQFIAFPALMSASSLRKQAELVHQCSLVLLLMHDMLDSSRSSSSPGLVAFLTRLVDAQAKATLARQFLARAAGDARRRRSRPAGLNHLAMVRHVWFR